MTEQPGEESGSSTGPQGGDAGDQITPAGTDTDEDESPKALTREEVEARYDFNSFTPAQLDRMTVEEWEAAFDPESWVTGPELLDRVQAELADRVVRRVMFAVVERIERGGEEHVLAYSDTEYAFVGPGGGVEGKGALRSEVEAVVVLCAMDEYEPPELPEGPLLPHPDEVAQGSGQLGNRLLMLLAGALLIAGSALLVSPLLVDLGGRGSALLTTVSGIGFAVVGLLLFLLVANARLSDRFRAEEYRRRLQAAGVGTDERPEFVPVENHDQPGA